MSKIATAFIKRKTDEAVALVQERKVLDPRARVAKDLLAMWGMCPLGYGAGVDKKAELVPVETIIERACQAAELLYAEADRRGWTVELPSHDEVNAEVAEAA